MKTAKQGSISNASIGMQDGVREIKLIVDSPPGSQLSILRPRLMTRRPIDKHGANAKPQCDVLGRLSCQKCCQELQRAESSARSRSEASSYMRAPSRDRRRLTSAPFSPSRIGSCIICESRNDVDETRIDRTVRSLFPIIYTSMSGRIDGTPDSAHAQSYASASRPMTALSIASTCLREFDDEEDNLPEQSGMENPFFKFTVNPNLVRKSTSQSNRAENFYDLLRRTSSTGVLLGG